MPDLTRRSFVVLGAAAAAARSTSPVWPRELAWTDVADWAIEGRAFAERKATYDRLPARAEGVVRKAVWGLSRHSAGMVVRFTTNTPELRVRYRLTEERLAMPHMPATGVSGVDLYGQDADGWRWIQVTRPSRRDVEQRLFANQPANGKVRDFQLYLPLYNGVEKLELGTVAGSKLKPMALRGPKQKPIVCYGTSITHGACASRPGMAWPAIVGRQLDREVVNLGFSGNGRMETAVGQFLCELDPSVFVIDCLPNMTPEHVAARTQPLVRQLRAKRKDTPILLVEDRTFAGAWFRESQRQDHERRREALRTACNELRRDGVENLHLLRGETLLGGDSEGTTDGSHPNDLGMMRQAAAVVAALRGILNR